jgi:hypothetical protein
LHFVVDLGVDVMENITSTQRATKSGLSSGFELMDDKNPCS